MLKHPLYKGWRLCLNLCCLCLLAACSAHDLPGARHAFYQGNYGLAEKEIGTGAVAGKDSVLLLMERGMIYQAEGRYEKSALDFIQAYDILAGLQSYSISEGAESWIANDTVYSFAGAPFEQTLIHSMAALNHLALGNWEDGGVEARRIIHSLKDEERGKEYPDDPFSRYLAAFILEMTGDPSNARLQYRLADELLPETRIDEQGWIGHDTRKSSSMAKGGRVLVCFFLVGHSPAMRELQQEFGASIFPPHIQIYTDGKYLGDGAVFSSVHTLALSTWNLEAPARIAKMAARIAAKEAMAVSLDEQDAALGALARIILIGMLERPDFRRWETLPRWLGVARIPCPEDLSSFEVRIQRGGELVRGSFTVQHPLIRRGNVFFSFVRDLPDFNSPRIKKEIDKVQ